MHGIGARHVRTCLTCVQVSELCVLYLQVPPKLRFRSAGAQQTGVVISDNLNCVSDVVCAEVCSECGVHVCMDM